MVDWKNKRRFSDYVPCGGNPCANTRLYSGSRDPNFNNKFPFIDLYMIFSEFKNSKHWRRSSNESKTRIVREFSEKIAHEIARIFVQRNPSLKLEYVSASPLITAFATRRNHRKASSRENQDPHSAMEINVYHISRLFP